MVPAESRTPPVLVIALFATIALVLIFCRSIEENLEVDENVFVASAALLNEGLLPYRDFHYNHMPSLVIIYAGLFKLGTHLLLIARSFSALCAAATVTLMFVVAWRAFAGLAPSRRLGFAIGIGALFLFNPLFVYTTGLAWNHDFPLLCCFAGFLILGQGLAKGPGLLCPILAGVLVGLAATSRVTFATALLPFGVFLLLYPGIPWRRKLLLVPAFGAGVVLATIPSIWVWMQSPQNAWFGNFVYPSLSTRYHLEFDVSRKRPFTVGARLLHIFISCFTLPGNGLVVGSFIGLTIATLRVRQVRIDTRVCEQFAILLLVIVLFTAGFAAAPLQRQYLYAATPFMILGIVRGLAAMPHLLASRRFGRLAVGGLVLIIPFGAVEYDGLLHLGSIRSWTPVQIHEVGVRIAAESPPGRIMTIEPVYALEGGRAIYPELATGRFGIRAGQYLSEAQQAQYRMPGRGDLVDLFDTNPPAAVFIGAADGRIENELSNRARAGGYTPVDFPDVGTLWTAIPKPSTGTSEPLPP
ncbi:MAG: hypothetical protein H7144_11335 [Burkholderiales bacterium]|nr:hypothetical protein [Phycisphaerae bacterium]